VQNKLLLSSVVHSLATAAAEANRLLHSDYENAVKNSPSIPPPLTITDVKMSFSSNVSRADRAFGGDLVLDFSKPSNFQGEIKLRPYSPQAMDYSEPEHNEPEQNESGYDEPNQAL